MKKCYLIFLLLTLIIILPSCGNGNVDLPQFKVEYYVDNVIYKTETVEKGNPLTKPEDPVKEDAFFDGWYVEGEKWQFTSGAVFKDLRLDAKFNEVDPNLGIVPVYQGMSASDVPNERVKLSGTKDIEDEVLPGIDVIETEGVEFFAKKGEKYLVTVHLYNPASYEILSFTLNGKKYQSFEFKEGSNSTELIIEQEAPMSSGRHDLTIDAIKYVDGTDILDVRMEGDKTITIGVTYENLPKAKFIQEEITYNSYKSSIEIIDEASILGENDVFIYLYDGVKIVENHELSLGLNVIEFKNLEMGQNYQYMIVGVYDSLDSVGKKANVLYKSSFKTLDGAIITDIKVTQDKVIFNPIILNNTAKLSCISLYKGNELVKSSKTSLKEFSNLLSNTDYKIILEYQFNLNEKIVKKNIEYKFKTKEKVAPKLEFSELKNSKNSISGSILLDDNDTTIISIQIKLYLNGILMNSTNNLDFSFNNLLSNSNYLLEVKYSYDLNDGTGIIEKVLNTNLRTLEYTIPKVDIILSSTIDNIDFDIILNDPDNVTTFKYINLYQGDLLINSLTNLSVKSFSNLKANVLYIIRVLYTYDLNDGEGIHNLEISKNIITNKEVPTINFTPYLITSDMVEFNLLISDNNVVGRVNSISLYANGSFISKINESDSKLTDLDSNTVYTIKVNYVYDFDDGYGSRELNEEFTFKTLKENPTYELFASNVTKTSITINHNIVDNDHALTFNKVDLYLGKDLINSYTSIDDITFNNLLSNNVYNIIVNFTSDLNNGPVDITKEIEVKTMSMEKPDVDISLISKKESIGFSYNIIDRDNISNLLSVSLLYDGKELDIDSVNNTYSNLLSNALYKFKVVLECDYNDGNGIVKEEYIKDVKTLKKQAPFVDLKFTSTSETITPEIIFVDYDGVGTLVRIDLYRNNIFVKSITDLDNPILDNLLSNTRYQIRLVYLYNLNDGTGDHEEIFEKDYSTTAFNVKIIGYQVLNEFSPKTSEDINIELKLDNQSKVFINYFIINGKKYDIIGGNHIDSVIIIVPANKVSGPQEIVIDKMGYVVNDINVEQEVENEVIINVEIFSRLDVIKVMPINGSNIVNSIYEQGLVFVIDNPNNYEILSVQLGKYGSECEYNAYQIDNNHFFVAVPMRNIDINSVTISKITYISDSGNTAVRNKNQIINTDLVSISPNGNSFSVEINKITTPEEFLNMVDGEAYELVNDIDMAGYEWNIKPFNGSFDGKGHKIKNLTYVNDYENNIKNISIFSSLEGIFKNVCFENLYFSVSSNEVINTSILGQSYDCKLENIVINGAFNLNLNNSNGYNLNTIKDSAFYILDYFKINNTDLSTLSNINNVTNDQFNNEEFRKNTFGWNFTPIEYKQYNDFLYYIVDNSYIMINKYIGNDECVTIPETIDGKKVIGIDDFAFKDCSNLHSFTSNNNLLSLGLQMFSGCSNLNCLELYNLILGRNDFYNYFGNVLYLLFEEQSDILDNIDNLIISIDDKVNSYDLSKIITSNVYPSLLYLPKNIKYKSHLNCDEFSGVIFFEGDNDEFLDAFNNEVPSLFTKCIEYNVKEFNCQYVNDNEFSYYLVNDKIYQLMCNDKSLKYINFNTFNNYQIVHIGDNCFRNMNDLNSIVLPDGIKYLGNYCFSDCNNLYNVSLPCSIERINYHIFEKTNLKILNIDSLVNYCQIYFVSALASYFNDLYLYIDNSLVNNLVIPGEATCINKYAFNSFSGFTSIVIQDGISIINEYAFGSLENLSILSLPLSLTTIEKYAFNSNKENVTIYYAGSVNDWNNVNIKPYNNLIISSKIKYNSDINNIELVNDGTYTYILANGKDIYNLKCIDNSIHYADLINYFKDYNLIEIGKNCFNSCSNLYKIDLPKTVKFIGDHAFYYKLTYLNIESLYDYCLCDVGAIDGAPTLMVNNVIADYLVIPDGIIKLKTNTFTNFLNDFCVVLPDSLIEIEFSAFGRIKLIYITKNLLEIEHTFHDSISIIYQGSKSEFEKNYNFKERFLNIVSIKYDVESLDYVETEKYKYYVDNNNCIYQLSTNDKNIESINLTDDFPSNKVITIKKAGFSNCSKLKDITFDFYLEYIDESAFSNCTSLEKVNVNSLKKWLDIKFANDDANPLYIAHNFYIKNEFVTDLILPKGTLCVNAEAFVGNDFENIYLNDELQEMNRESFSPYKYSKTISIHVNSLNQWLKIDGLCSAYHLFDLYLKNDLLNEVIVDDSIKKIKSRAFYYNCNITKIVLSDSVSIIESGAFANMRNLKTFVPGKGLKKIGDNAFINSKVILEEIKFKDGLFEIGHEALGSAQFIYLPSTLTFVGKNNDIKNNNKANTAFFLESETIPNTWDINWNTTTKVYLNVKDFICGENTIDIFYNDGRKETINKN